MYSVAYKNVNFLWPFFASIHADIHTFIAVVIAASCFVLVCCRWIIMIIIYLLIIVQQLTNFVKLHETASVCVHVRLCMHVFDIGLLCMCVCECV